jgi:hypothetical protein
MSRIQPNRMDDAKASALTWVFMSFGHLLAGMSDANMLRFFKAVRSVSPASLREGMDEIIDAVAIGSPNTTLIRRLINESKRAEIHDMLMGVVSFKEMDLEEL